MTRVAVGTSICLTTQIGKPIGAPVGRRKSGGTGRAGQAAREERRPAENRYPTPTHAWQLKLALFITRNCIQPLRAQVLYVSL